MGVLDRILEEKPQTVEQASENVVDRILATPPRVTPGLAPGAPGKTTTETIPRVVPARQGVGFSESLKQGFIDDIDVRMRRLAKQKFPDDPGAIRKFGVIDGNIVFVNEDGLLEKATGGASDLAGSALSLTPEIAGSVAGTFASGAPVVGSAVGASGGRALKDIIGGAFFEDPTTPLSVLTNMGIEGATDLVAGGIGRGLTKLSERKAIEGVAVDTFNTTSKREAIKDATGIELDLAQVTNLPKLKALKLYARNFPGEAAEIMRANDELQAGQVDAAIQRLVNVISKESDAAAMGFKGINAAQAAIEGARAEVAGVVGPLYEQAFKDTTPVNLEPVIEVIEQKFKVAKGSRRTRLAQVRKLMNVAGGKDLDTSVQGLHNTKLAIDEMFEKRGSQALGATVRRDLVEVKAALLDQISQASPTYNIAREEFDRLTSAAVDPLRQSIVGVLSEIPDRRAATAAARMFNNGNVTAREIGVAKQAIMRTEGGETAWNGIVKQWLTDQFNRASKELQIGESVNVAGKFRQRVIGTRQQKAAMLEAIGPEARELFDVTMEALQMVSRTPTASSATEFNRQISQEVSGRVGSTIKTALSPKASAIEAIDQGHMQRMAVLIAEALTDPAKTEQLKLLAKVKPSTQRAAVAASVIGLSIIPRDAGGKLLFPPETLIPPVLEE